ncbi:DUF488 domain-containing protein [Ochrobactrum sp. SD129]|nr:DUF488 domain-containing protein [Ochrobactrum sp. SD129]
MSQPYFTIGHSDRSTEQFFSLLTKSSVRMIADVRKIPASRKNPQFNEDNLASTASELGMGYEHISDLGGLRPSQNIPAGTNDFWENKSFHNYADYALSDRFRTGLNHLIECGRNGSVAIMCAEAVWWRCHRRIIADYLIARGEVVFHIISDRNPEIAHLTDHASIQANGTIFYPTVRIGCL